MIIAQPTGIKIFSWIGTIYGGKPHYYVPFLYAQLFIILFTFGGMTGVILSNSSLDVALHDKPFYINQTYILISLSNINRSSFLIPFRSISSLSSSFPSSYYKAFWVGLMDGDGSIQINHWKNRVQQFRLVIKLKYTIANYNMLILLSKYVGGYVRLVSNNKFVIWVENDKNKIIEILQIFDEFPPITSRLFSQQQFMKDCMTHNSVTTYLANRDNKYILYPLPDQTSSFIFTLSYFPIWLSGFIEAESCFSIRKNGNHSFSIGQNNDIYILEAIKFYFNLPNIIREPSTNFYLIETYNKQSLINVINHCNQYPLQGEKLVSFKRLAAQLIKEIESKLFICVMLSYRYEIINRNNFGNTEQNIPPVLYRINISIANGEILFIMLKAHKYNKWRAQHQILGVQIPN